MYAALRIVRATAVLAIARPEHRQAPHATAPTSAPPATPVTKDQGWPVRWG